ncbi:MAG: AI-2E family transporter [Proteobacteria bacterium]|jgi:predicted PurR-regulated permease PerM|nr:AI-2E family transporter [Alphaproteobacteria bacterium]NCC03593.1 AI-2E family transporter [Pseudomonadota bacterium]
MTEKEVSREKTWFLLFAVFLGLIWLLRPILLPFVAGGVLAYFLDPAVDKLSLWRVPRWLGTLIVLAAAAVSAALLVLLIFPLVQSQIIALLHALPDYVQLVKAKLLPPIYDWLGRLSPTEVEKLKEAAGSYAGDAVGIAGKFVTEMISKGFALFDILTLLIITPVVAFYLLRDWPDVKKNIDTLVPRKQHGMVREATSDINKTLSGFLRGQALVCLSLAIIYSVGLSIVGLEYGATIGIIAGVLSFIPYVGSGFGLIVSMILAFIQFDDPWSIGAVLVVFLIGQGLEGYVLTPKLVGDRVGLHPVWILFALFAGGALFGFVGILIAVPVAAVLGVLARLAIKHYKDSALYKGGKSQSGRD